MAICSSSLLLIGSLCYWAQKRKLSLAKLKKENNEKRRRRKKAETWIKLILYPAEISHSPYDILTELNEKIDQLAATVQEQAAELYAQMKEACRRIEKHQWGSWIIWQNIHNWLMGRELDRKINCNCIIIQLGFCKGSWKFQIDFILRQCSPFFLFFDRAQLCLVVDVTYHIPCLESHFKGLLGRLLSVEVIKKRLSLLR